MFDLRVRGDTEYGDVPIPILGRVVMFVGAGGVPMVRRDDGSIEAMAGTGGGVATVPGTLSDKFIERAYFMGGYQEEAHTGTGGATFSVVLTNGCIQTVSLSANCTLTFPTPVDGLQFTLVLTQTTGGHSVVWPSVVRWAGGTAPTLTTTAGQVDVVGFMAVGARWLGFVGGLNFNPT